MIISRESGIHNAHAKRVITCIIAVGGRLIKANGRGHTISNITAYFGPILDYCRCVIVFHTITCSRGSGLLI
jgi:hypothetical protein